MISFLAFITGFSLATSSACLARGHNKLALLNFAAAVLNGYLWYSA